MDLSKEVGNMMRGTRSVVLHAAKDGNMNQLNQMMVAGLKLTHYLLQSQTLLSDEFCAYAEMGN